LTKEYNKSIVPKISKFNNRINDALKTMPDLTQLKLDDKRASEALNVDELKATISQESLKAQMLFAGKESAKRQVLIGYQFEQELRNKEKTDAQAARSFEDHLDVLSNCTYEAEVETPTGKTRETKKIITQQEKDQLLNTTTNS